MPLTETEAMTLSTARRDLSLARRNCVDAPHENWRPPIFRDRMNLVACVVAQVRRFLDLQYQSIYRDMRRLAATMSGKVLDVGCGAQPYRHLLSEGCHYRGIDSAVAGSHFGYRVPDTIYFDGDRWPAADASVDYVLATETLEHIPDPGGFLSEAFRCLRTGGELILTVPFAARWHYIPHDYWRFTPAALQRLLTTAGFSAIRVYARGNTLTVAAYKVMGVILVASIGRRPFTQDFGIARLLGLAALPLLPLLAVVGGLSLLGDGGNDCLGYTVLARRREGNQS
jgi:SAM-dependent methyltransferase